MEESKENIDQEVETFSSLLFRFYVTEGIENEDKTSNILISNSF